jgi:hypothetical protein
MEQAQLNLKHKYKFRKVQGISNSVPNRVFAQNSSAQININDQYTTPREVTHDNVKSPIKVSPGTMPHSSDVMSFSKLRAGHQGKVRVHYVGGTEPLRSATVDTFDQRLVNYNQGTSTFRNHIDQMSKTQHQFMKGTNE